TASLNSTCDISPLSLDSASPLILFCPSCDIQVGSNPVFAQPSPSGSASAGSTSPQTVLAPSSSSACAVPLIPVNVNVPATKSEPNKVTFFMKIPFLNI